MCHVPKCAGHNVGVYYQFARKVFARPDWQLISDRASDVIDFVLTGPMT
jgi:hypothetical protein